MRRSTIPIPMLPLLLLPLVLAWPATGQEAPAASAPARVAVLLPFVADALAGTDVDVVAGVRRALHEPVDPGVIDLGNPHSPSLERLAEANPDFVVGDRLIHAMLADDLALGGRVQVVLIDSTGVDSTLASLRDVGVRLGAGAVMEARVAAVEDALRAAALDPAPSVLALFGTPGAFYAVTERHWLGDLLVRLGYRNTAAGLTSSRRFPGLVALNDEVVAGLRPQLVLLISHGDPAAIRASLDQRIEAGGVWGRLGDSASLGVRVLDPALFSSNPGLGLASAADVLRGLATPDVATGP